MLYIKQFLHFLMSDTVLALTITVYFIAFTYVIGLLISSVFIRIQEWLRFRRKSK